MIIFFLLFFSRQIFLQLQHINKYIWSLSLVPDTWNFLIGVFFALKFVLVRWPWISLLHSKDGTVHQKDSVIKVGTISPTHLASGETEFYKKALKFWNSKHFQVSEHIEVACPEGMKALDPSSHTLFNISLPCGCSFITNQQT